MQAFVTEELIWALHRERVEDARRAYFVSQVQAESKDDSTPKDGPSRLPLKPFGPSDLRPANGR
ncbi:MAG TPA: hypothetical protein VLS25_13300 [Dehalococcoidia bacterium]|nr:hypothetical protein [Dehalococcoidia bacterium]